MLAKRIIPCLDVDAGRVVKGVKFVDIRDAGDPVEPLLENEIEPHGVAGRAHLVLEGDRRPVVVGAVEKDVALEVPSSALVGGDERERDEQSEQAEA